MAEAWNQGRPDAPHQRHRIIERRPALRPDPWKKFVDCDRDNVANALIAFLFVITGPLVVLIAVSAAGGLSEADVISWVCVGYGLGGVFSIVLSLLYRQPLMFHFSLPGTVLLGPALTHLGFSEVIGAYLVTAIAVVGA